MLHLLLAPLLALNSLQRAENLDRLCAEMRSGAPDLKRWEQACAEAKARLTPVETPKDYYALLRGLLPHYGISHTRFLNDPYAPKATPRRPLALTYERRGTLGVIRLRHFHDRGMKEFDRYKDALKSLHGVRRIALDLRANTGGFVDIPRLIASTVIKDTVRLVPSPGLRPPSPDGRGAGGEGAYGVPVDPHPDVRVKVPVEVWVDGNTESAGEYLALLLQTSGLPLYGGRTAGRLVADTRVFELPCGLRVQQGLGSFARPDGKPVEGNGLLPDAPLKNDIKDPR